MRYTPRFSDAHMLTVVCAAGILAAAGALPAQQQTAAADSISGRSATPPADAMTARIAAAAVPRAGERIYGRTQRPGLDQTTVILVRQGLPAGTDETAWPVQMRWVVLARRASDSFVADLYGRANDQGQLYLDGVLTEGTHIGSAIHIEADRDVGHGAVVTITPLRTN